MQAQDIGVRRVMLRIPEACKALGESKSGFYAGQAKGLITRSVKIGLRAAALPSDEIDAINEARIRGLSESEQRALVERLHDARRMVPA